MKKIPLLSSLFSLLILSAGCSGELDENELITEENVALQVSGGIRANSRAGETKWDANDAIGIYMLAHGTSEISDGTANRHYTTDADASGIFASAGNSQTIYFPVGGETMDFIAYYPYKSTLAGETYKVDVTAQASQKDIDLMSTVDAVSASKNAPSVAFRFVHQLVKLQLSVRADGKVMTDEDLKGMTVNITNQSATADFNVLTGRLSNMSSEKSTISLLVAGNGQSCEGIVLPAASTEGMVMEFVLKDKGVMRWKVSSAEKSQSFVAGSKYKYDIVLAGTGVKVTSTITDWTEGNGAGESGSAE